MVRLAGRLAPGRAMSLPPAGGDLSEAPPASPDTLAFGPNSS
jgi:hypothetical protein